MQNWISVGLNRCWNKEEEKMVFRCCLTILFVVGIAFWLVGWLVCLHGRNVMTETHKQFSVAETDNHAAKCSRIVVSINAKLFVLFQPNVTLGSTSCFYDWAAAVSWKHTSNLKLLRWATMLRSQLFIPLWKSKHNSRSQQWRIARLSSAIGSLIFLT